MADEDHPQMTQMEADEDIRREQSGGIRPLPA
jgi:hypothetical protein